MDKKEAIEVLKPLLESLEKRGRANILIPEVFTALKMAIESLSEPIPMSSFWIPITYRPMDEEEYEDFKKEFGELPIEHRKMFSCPMPEDDQEILICTSWGGVSQDRCEIDEYGYALETQGDWDGVIAWMPLPEPYKKEGE